LFLYHAGIGTAFEETPFYFYPVVYLLLKLTVCKLVRELLCDLLASWTA